MLNAEMLVKKTEEEALQEFLLSRLLNERSDSMRFYFARELGVSISLLPTIEITDDMVRRLDLGGTPYRIVGAWDVTVSGDGNACELD